MDRYKIDNFIKDNPNNEFPWFETVEGDALNRIKEKAFEAIEKELGLKEHEFSDKFEVINKCELSTNAEAEDFKLNAIVEEFDLAPQGVVYINWYKFDRIDKVKFSDLCNFFDYMWYPGSDDIEVFDDSLQWMISVSHGGQVSLKFSQ